MKLSKIILYTMLSFATITMANAHRYTHNTQFTTSDDDIKVVKEEGATELGLGNEAYKNKDFKTAYEQYLIAEQKGSSSAIANIGLLYENGFHLDKSISKAIEHYSKAIEMGNVFAKYRKAYILATNADFRDYKTAFTLFDESANANKDAKVWLAFMYERGKGVEPNFQKALEIYQQTADVGDDYSKKKLETLPKEMENGTAQFYIAESYMGEKEYQNAINWYVKSKNKGYVGAAYEIGNIYLQGLISPPDTTKAIDWFLKDSEKNNLKAHIALGNIYYVRKNYVESFKYKMKGAELGDANSLNSIGYMYHQGEGVAKDLNQAFKYYAAAADKGYPMAMHNVGVMYTYGAGVDKNLLAAKTWHEKALAAGYVASKERIVEIEKLMDEANTQGK